MRTVDIIAYVALVLVGATVYFGYNFYSELALERSCDQMQGKLVNVSNETLFARAGVLSGRFGLGVVDAGNNIALSRKIAEIRAAADNKGVTMTTAVDISELEALDSILGEYLSPGGCDFFKNYAKIGQSQFVYYYSNDFKTLLSNASDARILAASLREESKVSANIEQASRILTPGTACGLSNETARVLRDREKEYCFALYEHNAGLLTALKTSLDRSNDPYSKLYKSVLINCLTPCIKNEVSCTESCWIAQRDDLLGP